MERGGQGLREKWRLNCFLTLPKTGSAGKAPTAPYQVIYVLNTKCDEHELTLQALRDAHEEEIQRIMEEMQGKIQQYKSRVGEEMDLRQRLQALDEALEQHKLRKEEALADFNAYRRQTEERELRTETEHAERIMSLSKEMLDMKKDFENKLQNFDQLKEQLEQNKEKAVAELERVSQESLSLQDECQVLRRSSLDERGRLEEMCNSKTQALWEEVEELRTEKLKLTEECSHNICSLKAEHEEQQKALKRTLQQSMTDTLKQWQQQELEQRKALQQKLKRTEGELDAKGQRLNDCKRHAVKLQERIQELEMQLQEARCKVSEAVDNMRKSEEELSVAKERLILQEDEILNKSEALMIHCSSQNKASAEVEESRNQVLQFQKRIRELEQKSNGKNTEHAQQVKQNELSLSLRLECDRLCKRLEKEHAEKQLSALNHMQKEKESEIRKINEEWQREIEELQSQVQDNNVAPIQSLSHVDQKFESSQLVSQDALQKLEAQFIKEKEILEQELQDSIKLNRNLKAQLDAANQQTLKHAENTNQQLKEAEERLQKQQDEKLQEEQQRHRLALQSLEEKASEGIVAERQRMEKQQRSLLETQKVELTQQHAGWCRQVAQRHMKQIEDLQTELSTRRELNMQQQEGGQQNPFQALRHQLEEYQSVVCSLRNENAHLKDQLASLSSEVQFRKQEVFQLQNTEEQQRRSIEDDLVTRHHIELESLKQEQRKEIQTIVSDFSSAQTRLQARIVSLETEYGLTVYLVKLQRNSDIVHAHKYKKKKTEETPPRVISVPNLSSYEKSFLGSEPNPVKRSPQAIPSPSSDHGRSVCRPFNASARIPELKPTRSPVEEKCQDEGAELQDPQRQEWFTKYFSF
ncbi:UNVERIFIED_CONTAM: hypothetical protein FKN15_016941 [Acipenser sinensis]